MGYLTNINITKLLYVWLVFTCFLPNTVTVSGSAARDTKSMQGNEYQKVMEPDQRFYKRMRYSDWTRRFLLPNSKDRNANSFNKHIVAKRYQEIAEKFPHLQQYHKVLSNPTKSSFGANFDRGSTEITGMWAVKLKIGPENNSRDRLDQAAERIAMQHGLENHGQIGELKGKHRRMILPIPNDSGSVSRGNIFCSYRLLPLYEKGRFENLDHDGFRRGTRRREKKRQCNRAYT